MDTWTCTTGINWTIGATTTTDVIANDNINVIRMDNGSELPPGVLGRCTSRWSGCGGATIEWYVEELDIVFDDATNWNFGPALPGFTEYDFESVSVHELGHGHQLGHVINTNDVMHYAISNGEDNRVLSANNIAGASDVQSRSTGGSVCSQTVMTGFSCGSAPVADFSGTPTTLCEGATVSFTDLSTNTPTGWSWSFTGGTPSTSTAQNPTITYNTAGVYAVTLTATNAFGSDPETKTGYITVNACGTTKLRNADCGKVMTDYLSYITCDYVAGATEYEYEFVNVGLGYNQTYVRSNPTYRFVYVNNVPGIQNGTTYDVRVRAKVGGLYGNYGTVCQITTPASTITTQLRSTDCGLAMTSYNNYINCDYVSQATEYEYEFVNVGLGYNQTVVRPSNYRFIYVNTVSGILDNTTYDVRVRAKIGGTYTSYGSVCQITTPAGLTTKLRSSDCGIVMTSYSNFITCDQVANATEYEYEFVNGGLGYNETYIRSNPTYRFLYVDSMPGIQLGRTYDVRVRAKVGGVYTSYGSVCQVTTPSSPRLASPELALQDENIIENSIEAIIYPNPNQGEFIYVNLNGLQNNSELIVTDISGKIIQQETVNTDEDNYNGTIRFNEKLNSGFYFITIVSGNQKITKKLVVR
jgi:PKD repeat protein